TTVLATTRSGQSTGLLQAYPNPASGNSLTISRPRSSSAGQVAVYNLSGQLVLTAPSLSGTTDTSLPIGRLSAGTYLVRYTDAEQTLVTRFTKE
ncbi:MAG: T9SS type A sorting domain-containing protein, partial [Cytophagaceae bacterium]